MKGSVCFIGDNTGVLKVKCIGILGNLRGVVGDMGVFSLLVVSTGEFKRGIVLRGVFLKTRKFIYRSTGHYLKACINLVALCKWNDELNELEPFGTRILSSVFFELKLKGFLRLVAISRNLI